MTPHNPNSKICPHCKMNKNIRNPSGYCDHLHYPEACNICQAMQPIESKRFSGADLQELLKKVKSKAVRTIISIPGYGDDFVRVKDIISEFKRVGVEEG
jgi:hypothetical protein